jgi:hypothetical protein
VQGNTKQSALNAFHDNMQDAKLLVSLGQALTNSRKRRMRKEMREAIGNALRMRTRDKEQLDCVESSYFFVAIKPYSTLKREDLNDVRPLLRQALVAGASAVETYVADRVMEFVGPTLRQEDLPTKLKSVQLSVDDYLYIRKYDRPGWGLRRVIESHVQDVASLAPGQIGRAFALVGKQQVLRKIDKRRGLKINTSSQRLQAIYDRRNRLAHTADRSGRGRATLSVDKVHNDLQELQEVVEALNVVTANG